MKDFKTYTYKEIEIQLKFFLSETKHILTFGTIGSCNINSDIDIIITKRINSPSDKFFKEIHTVFKHLDEFLQNKHNSRLIRTSRFSDEEETKYIANFSISSYDLCILFPNRKTLAC